MEIVLSRCVDYVCSVLCLFITVLTFLVMSIDRHVYRDLYFICVVFILCLIHTDAC